MQTPAERELVHQLHDVLRDRQDEANVPLILNIGAGRTILIEKQLSDLGCKYLCDRIDIDDCSIEFPTVRHSRICSVEEMTPLKSGEYLASFANYVLEHVMDIQEASREICRILRPSGLFITSLPNPSAPEFIVARNTPLWFHKKVSKAEAWETHYSWNSLHELVEIFKTNGLDVQSIKYWSFTEGYLWRYPVVNSLSRLYDRIITGSGVKRLMGNVCAVFKKTSD